MLGLAGSGCGSESLDPCVNGQAAWKKVEVPAELVARRASHSAVWTGTEVLIWGGFGADGAPLNSGFRWNPLTGEARAITEVGAPSPRFGHYSRWIGDAMLVYGGLIVENLPDSRFGKAVSGGAFYYPDRDEWLAIAEAGGPGSRDCAATTWTPRGLFVFGGTSDPGTAEQAPARNGFLYDPSVKAWTEIAASPPGFESFCDAGVLATDKVVLVAGGSTWRFEGANTGARYDFTSDAWTPMAAGAPPECTWADPPAVWNGAGAMLCSILLGCYRTATGGDDWQPVPKDGVPPSGAGMGWDVRGDRLFVLGGDRTLLGADHGGAVYDAGSDAWQALPTECAPSPRRKLSATWTNAGVLVWGGRNDDYGDTATLVRDVGWLLQADRIP